MDIDLMDKKKFYDSEIRPKIYSSLGFLIIFFTSYVLTYFLLVEFINLKFLTSISTTDLLLEVPIILIFEFFAWIFINKVPHFKNDEVGILLAVTKIDKTTDEELEKLYKNIETAIVVEKLNLKVLVRYVPERLIPRNEKDAHKIRDKMRAHVIIWGNVDNGFENNEKQTNFIPIFFSFRIGLPQNTVQILTNNISNLLREKSGLLLKGIILLTEHTLQRT